MPAYARVENGIVTNIVTWQNGFNDVETDPAYVPLGSLVAVGRPGGPIRAGDRVEPAAAATAVDQEP